MTVSDATLCWPGGAARFDLERGIFDVTIGAVCLRELEPAVETDRAAIGGGSCTWSVVSHEASRLACVGRADGLRLDLVFTRRDLSAGARRLAALEIDLRVTFDAATSVERIVLFRGGRSAAPEWIYSMAHRGHRKGSTRAVDGTEFASTHATGWTSRGQTLFLTAPMRQSYPCTLRGTVADGQVVDLTADCRVGVDGVTEVGAHPLTLCATDEPFAFLEAYGDAQRQEPMRPAARRPVAWNSWDYIRDLVSEDYVLRNLDVIAGDPVLSRHVEYIVVDSGWEHRYGDWIANPRFPHGMEWLARQIVDRGFQPGLWLAPTILENCSGPALWDTQLLAHGRAGVPCQAYECMRRFGFVLDVRRPAARAWLRETFTRYREMGFSYFKTDFLRHIKNAVFFNGQRVPKGDLVREVLEIVRDAIGPDAHLLGCNYEAETGCGLIDSNRISGDISPHWETVEKNALSLASCFWQHGRVWCNDPDFAVCRGPETSQDPDLDRMHAGDILLSPDDTQARRRPFLSDVEARTLLSLVILTGGSVTLSDNLPVLNDTGMELLRRTVAAPPGRTLRPLDLFATEIPSLWLQAMDGGGQRLGVVNWDDEPARRSLDLAALTGRPCARATDFWSGAELQPDNPLSLQLAPHETRLLELAP